MADAESRTPSFPAEEYAFTRQPVPRFCMDPTHVELLYRVLRAGRFRRVLEIGCYSGASTSAFVEALNQGEPFELHLCDLRFLPELHRLVALCGRPEAIHLHERPSYELLPEALGEEFDLVLVDGDHRLPAVRAEVEQLLAHGVVTVMAHDTSNWRPECEGARYLREVFLAHPGYYCLEDNAPRPGEETTRGLFLATRDRELYERFSQAGEWRAMPDLRGEVAGVSALGGSKRGVRKEGRGDLVRLVHIIPIIGVGGTEGLLLELCRHRDRERYATTVVATSGALSVIADEIRATGTPVYREWDAARAAIAEADLVNLHWWGYSEGYLRLAGKKPHVTTLHWQIVPPPIPTLTICTSRYVYDLQPDKLRFVAIPNGVDVDRFAPAEGVERPEREGADPDEVMITRVCRPPKCAPYFWDALHLVLRRYPQARLRIVGNPEPLPSSPQVEFLGVRRDIPQILRQSDLFVYTPYPESGTKDLVVMEAAAAGLPCVVSDVSVVRESVEAGRTGFLTPFGDVEALAARVGQLIEDHELRRRMGAAAARHAREQFDVRGVARRYEAVYRAVLDAWRAG